MLKLLSILTLVVLSQSAFLAEKELKAPKNSFIDNVMKCIAEVKPVFEEVPEIIKAWTEFDFAKVIELIQKVYIDGYLAGMKCYFIFVGEPLLGESLPDWVIGLIYQFGRGLLNMLATFGIEHLRGPICCFMLRHGI